MKMKKIVKIVFIGLSVLIIVLTICIIIWLFHQKSDISDVPNQISVSSGNQISSTINMEEDLEWYDTLDEAKQDVSIIKKMKIMWHIDPRQRKLYKKNMKIG
ncbi:MAG: hypothetical protein ACLVEZ_07205 [Mediterraneibacter faecis]|mgnify:FL=1|nr:hypothetical protein DW977_14635 [Ruminococcus sp. AM49-10BH]RGI44227.1 hypothetical protein DXB52_14085 [Ruminococcus sp. OM04-4AA]